MYHSTPLRLVRTLVKTCILTAFLGVQAVLATEPCLWPLLSSQNNFKHKPSAVELYQLDKEPIQNRRPLLMVHGLCGESHPGLRWTKVTRFLASSQEFQKNYKIFFARYNTTQPISQISLHFKEALRALWKETQHKPITVLALSIGGNYIQAAMEDSDVSNMIQAVLTLGTPFHGSPLFCANWMKYSMLRNHSFPWVSYDLLLTYQLYFHRHQNLLQDFQWNNVDKCMPCIGSNNTEINNFSAGNNLLRSNKSKFIAYSSYLLNPYIISSKYRSLKTALSFPWWFTTTTVPFHLGREHPVLRVLNHELGQMQATAAKDRNQANTRQRIYSLNDGITPIASALSLPPEACCLFNELKESDLVKLKSYSEVNTARLFRNADHLTFIDGWRPAGAPEELKDEFHPEQPARTIFAWILSDLLSPVHELVISDSDSFTKNYQD